MVEILRLQRGAKKSRTAVVGANLFSQVQRMATSAGRDATSQSTARRGSGPGTTFRQPHRAGSALQHLIIEPFLPNFPAAGNRPL